MFQFPDSPTRHYEVLRGNKPYCYFTSYVTSYLSHFHCAFSFLTNYFQNQINFHRIILLPLYIVSEAGKPGFLVYPQWYMVSCFFIQSPLLAGVMKSDRGQGDSSYWDNNSSQALQFLHCLLLSKWQATYLVPSKCLTTLGTCRLPEVKDVTTDL